MIIDFYGPFDKLIAKHVTLDLTEPTPVKAVLRMLAERYPAFARYCQSESDAALSAHITLLRNATLLKLEDIVKNEDQISILLPATGG